MKTYEIYRPKVLIVDKDVENLILLKSMLDSMEFDLFIAKNGKEALGRVEQNNFDLILMDTLMPDMDGYEVCRKIRGNENKNDVSIIFLSTMQSRENKMKGFSSGGDDYLTKPLYQPEVIARVKLHLEKHMIVKRLKQLLRHSYHELYNPLAIIETSAQMYDAKNPPNKYVNAMHAASRSLHLIYEDLFYALSSQKNEDIKDSINLGNLINERISFFSLLADVKGITFNLNIANDIFILIPQFDLQRIIDNTISNAIKYSFENTVITINLLHDANITFSVGNVGSEIQDTDKIFTLGYREAYEQSGMGIGLEIVASICSHYNIKTFVVSKNNVTIFKYIFDTEEE